MCGRYVVIVGGAGSELPGPELFDLARRKKTHPEPARQAARADPIGIGP